MINFKSSDPQIERLPHTADAPISLTWLWEVVVRTKRLPDGLDSALLFTILRERLRNPEREVRQHALRVLADLIPVIDHRALDNHMEPILPELVHNLSHIAPSVRKGAIDVMRIHLKHCPHRNETLRNFIKSVPLDSHLLQGLHMAAPYFITHLTNEDTIIFTLKRLLDGLTQDSTKDASIFALVKLRIKLGKNRFEALLEKGALDQFYLICKEQNIQLESKDNVILETEITLDSGPAITMKIHEESRNYDSEPELGPRSPRKVHFGGEVVKMRTPESDSNHQSSDDNDMHTSLVIDRPTSIKITVHDGVTAIKTRHKSLIPVRVTTTGPSTPRRAPLKKRLHQSAPELRSVSKIPLRRARSKVRRRSREEDALSPVPIHNEIEVFHNLTRSPTRSEPDVQQTEFVYPSFQVYQEANNSISTSSDFVEKNPLLLDHAVRDLISKDDKWSKNRALTDLITIISSGEPELATVANVELLRALFYAEKDKRTQTKAQEALSLIITRTSLHNLNSDVVSELANGLLQIAPPSGVRLALLAMEKSSPRQYFEHVQANAGHSEEMLQVLIAATRSFPSSEINVIKGAQLAFEAMKTPKRSVRQAALETLASLAQIAGNAVILHTISELVQDEDSESFLRVVRTRLSRRQLPTVDMNGNVRYSSPREQEELDWLCGAAREPLPLNLIAAAPNNNYWRRNLRHDNTPTAEEGKEQVWAIDGGVFPKIETPKIEKATLYPLYVLHRDTPQVNGKRYRNYDRGRSSSPPNAPKTERFVPQHRPSESFRKSFSSEQLYNAKVQELRSCSLSSSSATSTGSSTRSGVWFRSGIPVPVDAKFRFRTHREYHNGPLIAHDFNRAKLESAANSPSIPKNATPPHLLPPSSGGSESSGYFTPPAEQFKEPPLERFISEENNNHQSSLDEPEPIFEIIESETDIRNGSASSSERMVLIPDENIDQSIDQIDNVPYSPLQDVNFDEIQRNFDEPRSKSRSENTFTTSLPEINKRKNISSAPPLNEIVALVPYSFAERPIELQLPTSLPGAVATTEEAPALVKEETPKRLLRRSISVRTSSLKRVPKTPSSPEIRPLTRPKEALNQALAQMDNPEWEVNMQGLNNLVRLCRTNPEVFEPHIHPVCLTLAKNIRNLRSQVARNACRAASELFATCKRNLDMEIDELAGPLLHRSADTNKFLRSDANAALDAMSLNLSVSRVVAVVANKGAGHQNGVVRASAARLLSDVAMRLGPDKVFQLPKEIRDKFLLVGANGLTEGSLESRKHAKELLGTLAKHQGFQRALLEAVPQHTLRHISKSLKAFFK